MRAVLILIALALTIFWLAVGMPALFGYEQALANATSTRTIVDADGNVREYGWGLIRFNGRGPERWRYSAVIHYEERRQAETEEGRVKRELAEARLELRRGFRLPTGHWLDGAFLCIHRFERGSDGWQTDTGNGYRGGLQMDRSFASTYAPPWVKETFGWNPARWPASVQIAVSIRAWVSRGFNPWPNTARECGLLR